MIPFRSQFNDLIVKFNADAPAHANDHAFPLKYFKPLLEVINNILCDELYAFFASNNCFKPCPFAFQLFFFLYFLAFCDIFKFRIDLGALLRL